MYTINIQGVHERFSLIMSKITNIKFPVRIYIANFFFLVVINVNISSLFVYSASNNKKKTKQLH
jgi:hypothetical protein